MPPGSDGGALGEKWELSPGDRLGDYELVECVGGGGMGRVFRARDTRLGRIVALKVLSAEQAADANTLLRFQNEAQSAARLDHQNIARVHCVSEDRGIPFIVFEYVEGINIRDLVAGKGPLSLAEAVSYTLQIAQALSHAASREVVHRDIKPSNVLITPQGAAKLIDLGLARLQPADPSTADLTASGVTLGTFDYISPEQARDPRTADVRSDIYSLGCTFFYMLTGRPPFPEGTMLQKLLQHQGDQPPDVRQFRPDLPEEVSRLLRKMLAKDPRHRYQDPGELVEEIVLLAEQVGLQPVRADGKVWAVARPRTVSFWERHLPWIVPVAALVCIVVLLDFLWSSPARREEPGPPRLVAGAEEVEKQQLSAEDRSSSTKRQEGLEPASSEQAQAASSVTAPAAGKLRPPAGPAVTSEPPDEAGGDASPPSATPKPELQTAPPAPEPSQAKPTTKHAGVLVVGEHAAGEKDFPTLSAACSAATSGDVIELRYNGRREQRPIALASLKVTIRGGEGFQPVVVFQPAEMDPIKYPRSMFAVTGGRLTLINLALELDIPRGVPAESWSLCEIQGGEAVRVEKCSLTIRNASSQRTDYHQEVAFFRLKPAPGAEVTVGQASAAASPAAIELADCIARGEGVLFRAESLQPVRLSWENGLLATSECLLSADVGPEPPKPGEMLQIDLRHLTAAVRRGLCRMVAGPSTSYQLTTRIHCADSILLGTAGVPLIEQLGTDSVEDCRRWIEWNGDRNFYEGWTVFWTISGVDPNIPPEPMSFDAWQSHWGSERESLPAWNRVAWKSLPQPGRQFHTHTPADYALDDASSANPARGAADDGRDAGVEADQLPLLPSESAAANR